MKSAIDRLYHSITEISRILGEEQHVLRYWEREFPQLKPQKNRAGNRVYTTKDVAVLRVIKKLLREERYTVAGAKEYLKQHGPGILEVEEMPELPVVGSAPKVVDVKEVARKTAKELRSIAKDLRSRAEQEKTK